MGSFFFFDIYFWLQEGLTSRPCRRSSPSTLPASIRAGTCCSLDEFSSWTVPIHIFFFLLWYRHAKEWIETNPCSSYPFPLPLTCPLSWYFILFYWTGERKDEVFSLLIFFFFKFKQMWKKVLSLFPSHCRSFPPIQ